ncbi:hypothetical protein D3C87_1692870 [compost metagenome]
MKINIRLIFSMLSICVMTILFLVPELINRKLTELILVISGKFAVSLELRLALVISNLEAVMTEPLLVLVFPGIFQKTLILEEILKTCILQVSITKQMKALITIKN